MNPINIYQSFFDRSPFTRIFVTRIYYQLVSKVLEKADVSFMDYGYAELGENPYAIRLDESDEPHWLPIQMYHHLASSVGLEGKDVLEISCGRGGGAAFINRYHHPRSYVGIDRTDEAILYCRRKHRQPGLAFLQGDAEAIDYGNECFDVVINVEASHLYAHVETFLAEVFRVLRPGGYLLLADKRTSDEVRLLRQQISSSGLCLISENDISANVLRSIELQKAERMRTIRKLLPGNLSRLAFQMVGVDGSHLGNALANGYSVYLSFILRKVG